MRYRSLGDTGIEISEIGFGTWGLGGNSYGPTDDTESLSALDRALEKGVTFYDTSDLYGNGHAETLVGKAFKNKRDKVIIGTKGGMLPHTGFYMPQDFSEPFLRKALENSLDRLCTDYVDLYLLHSPTVEDMGQALETLVKFKEEGKIRSYGVSVRSPQDGLTAIKDFNVQAIQTNYNIIDQRASELGLLDLALEENVGVIARTPLAFGYLTGSLTGTESFGGIDHRNNWPQEQLKRWAKAPGMFSFLHENSERTATQAALLFCLANKAVSTTIPGMMNLDHVNENTGTSDLTPYTESEVSKIIEVYKTNSSQFYDKSFVKVKETSESESKNANF